MFIFYPLSGINPDTLNPATTKPKYRTKNRHRVEHLNSRALPAGKYRLFAIKDEYKDQLYSVESTRVWRAALGHCVASGQYPSVHLRVGVAVNITRPQLYDVQSINPTTIEATFSEDIDTASLAPGNYMVRDSAGQLGVTTKAVWMNSKNGKSVYFRRSCARYKHEVEALHSPRRYNGSRSCR